MTTLQLLEKLTPVRQLLENFKASMMCNLDVMEAYSEMRCPEYSPQMIEACAEFELKSGNALTLWADICLKGDKVLLDIRILETDEQGQRTLSSQEETLPFDAQVIESSLKNFILNAQLSFDLLFAPSPPLLDCC